MSPILARARRTATTFALALAGAAALAPTASATLYPNEAALRDVGHDRNTFIYDPGQGNYMSPELIASLGDYYGRQGFDRNFTQWAPSDYVAIDGAARWTHCAPPFTGNPCESTIGDSRVDATLTDTRMHVRHWNGAFIARICGNFSRGGGAGPIPHIAGTKYEDVNGNGARDAGEPGLAGWTIVLRQDGHDVASTVTDGAGNYDFALNANTLNLHYGNFQLAEIQQGGWVNSAAPAPVNVPVGASQHTFGGNDFGNFRPVTIEGRKVEDLDADGDVAGDPGVEGWTISAGSEQRQTDASGAYRFTGLRPGTYTVSEATVAGWNQSVPASGSYTVQLSSGQTASDRDFANWRPATIDGRKFNDHAVDGDGAGDEGLGDWTISLDDDRSTVTADDDGGYEFGNLRPGTYTVTEQLRDGWRQTAPSSGSHTVRVRSNDRASDRDFGNVCLGAASVSVVDVDGLALPEAPEVRLEEIEVPGILDNEPTLPRTASAPGTFDELLPGTYRVTVFLPAGVFTTDSDAQIVDGDWAIVKSIDVTDCETESLAVQVFTASTGKITGVGLKTDVDGGFATAGFEFMAGNTGAARGTLQFVDHPLSMSLHTAAIEGIRVSNDRTEAWVWGSIEHEGTEKRFRLYLVDAGEPGTADRFELDILADYRAGHGQVIHAGNVQIHKR